MNKCVIICSNLKNTQELLTKSKIIMEQLVNQLICNKIIRKLKVLKNTDFIFLCQMIIKNFLILIIKNYKKLKKNNLVLYLIILIFFFYILYFKKIKKKKKMNNNK